MKEDELVQIIETLPEKYRPSRDAKLERLPGGSDRRFVRINDQGQTMILLISDPVDKEFNYYIQIQQFLYKKGLGVPEIYYKDEGSRIILMEDVGDNSVEYLAREVLKGEEIAKLYKGVLIFLAELQIEGYRGYEDCPAIKERIFDYAMLRGETDYFKEYFLEKFCRIDSSRNRGVEKEFEFLARTLSKEPCYFMHRDFQSQNIFIKDGRVRIVDFQSARQGLLTYDLAAVLKDAYVVLSDDVRMMLVNYYLTYLEKIKGLKLDREKFQYLFYLTGLQRNMQALAAFAYLSTVKGKTRYIRYIPAGVRYLQEALSLDAGKQFARLKRVLEEDVQKFLRSDQGVPMAGDGSR